MLGFNALSVVFLGMAGLTYARDAKRAAEVV